MASRDASQPAPGANQVDRGRLAGALSAERDLFVSLRPRSAELAERAGRHLLSGVPMPWMTRWPGAFPVHFTSAHGARFEDVDGIEYVDFCLGDTGAMSGHGLVAVADAVARNVRRG